MANIHVLDPDHLVGGNNVYEVDGGEISFNVSLNDMAIKGIKKLRVSFEVIERGSPIDRQITTCCGSNAGEQSS